MRPSKKREKYPAYRERELKLPRLWSEHTPLWYRIPE